MPAVPDANVLGALALFRGLSAAELARVNELLGRTRFPAGAMVMTATQPGEVAYIVLEGTLKVGVVQADGRELTLALLGPGEIVGELALADRAGRSADVEALEPATLLWLDQSAFRQLRREVPAVTENLLALLARRVRLTNARLLAMAMLDVHGRVSSQLLALADALGEPQPGGDVLIPLRLTQGDLASLVGATRVRVNEVLVGFKRRRYLSVDGRHRVTIHDRAALAAYAESER
jgi:CRP/FNR family transcriptional regulator, cyclic AMP receptor protein